MAAKIGQCFTVDFSLRPQRLKSNGVYRHNFVLLDGQKLYLILAPAWQTLSSDFPYAKVLNFNRQVFQKKGGRLVQARGKLGYWLDGYGLFIAQRQDLRLDHLSRRKALNYVQLK